MDAATSTFSWSLEGSSAELGPAAFLNGSGPTETSIGEGANVFRDAGPINAENIFRSPKATTKTTVVFVIFAATKEGRKRRTGVDATRYECGRVKEKGNPSSEIVSALVNLETLSWFPDSIFLPLILLLLSQDLSTVC